MEKENKYPLELIDRCLRNIATPQEQSLMLVWRNESKDHEDYFHQIKKIYQYTKKDEKEFEPNEALAWQRLQDRINKQKEAASTQKVKTIKLMPFIKVAASLLVLISLTTIAWKKWQSRETHLTVLAGKNHKVVILPDSSKVWLKANGSLKYLSSFENSNREVYLEGEGFFEVRKKDGLPFRVIALRSVTEVLGTSFLIKSYSHLMQEEIEVSTGKVRFSSKSNKENFTILLPKERATLNYSGSVLKSKMENSNNLFWKTKQLDFDNQELSSVVGELNKYYETKIVIKNDGLAHCHFTGNFQNSSVEEVLKVIAMSVNAKLEIQKDQYYLSGMGCETK